MVRLFPAVRAAKLVVPFVLVGLFALSCEPSERPEPQVPDVVASIFPIADLTRVIAGDDARVRVLLRPGASPATFDPTPATVREVRDARLLVLVGGGLDGWAGELAASSGAHALTLLDGIRLEGEGDAAGTGNPHLWLDPVRTRDELLPRIADALVEVLPRARPRIEARAAALADTLTALDGEIRSALTPLENRSFVASHPAWAYYARRYDLRQVGVVHQHPGQEPSPRAVADVVDRARAAGVPVVFGEPQVADAAARSLAEELSIPLLTLDPLGGAEVPGRDSYTDLLRYNTAQFARGLSMIGAEGDDPS